MVLYSTIYFSTVELYGYFRNICSLFLGLKTLYKNKLQKGAVNLQFRNIAWRMQDWYYS